MILVKNKMKYFILSIIALFLISPLYAENTAIYLPNELEDPVHSLKIDVDRDGIVEEVTVTVEENESEETLYILTVRDGEDVSGKEVIGNYTPFYAFSLSLIKIGKDINPFIGLGYHCGAHSYKLLLFEYNNDSINKVFEFFSDVPSIVIEDVDSDSIKEIMCRNRDYGASPISDSYLETYKYVNWEWKRITTYRTATKEYLPGDWDKDESDTEVFKQNMKRFGMYEPEEWGG